MSQFAQITVSGFAGSKVDIKELKEGVSLLTFSIAVNSWYKGKEITNWYSVQLWNGAADDLLRRVSDDLTKVRGAYFTLSGKFIFESRVYEGRTYNDLILENPQILVFQPKRQLTEQPEVQQELVTA